MIVRAASACFSRPATTVSSPTPCFIYQWGRAAVAVFSYGPFWAPVVVEVAVAVVGLPQVAVAVAAAVGLPQVAVVVAAAVGLPQVVEEESRPSGLA
jgi:hypothetical protein